jgi:hypothetical protein
MTTAAKPSGAVDLYWIPLGAGANVVRLSGKVFEAASAFVQRRERCDLYHSALVIDVPEGRFVIEQTPIPDAHGDRRGVVAEGPVGTRRAGRLRRFRYEIRRWQGGRIPDVREALASPVRLASDQTTARRILDLLPSVPTPTWGRDELDAGEMWNSNSVISWVLARNETDLTTIHPPRRGRAPGWDAGRVAARDLGSEAVETCAVAREDQMLLPGRQARHRGLDRAPGVRPVGADVGIVVGPQDPFDADVVAHP